MAYETEREGKYFVVVEGLVEHGIDIEEILKPKTKCDDGYFSSYVAIQDGALFYLTLNKGTGQPRTKLTLVAVSTNQEDLDARVDRLQKTMNVTSVDKLKSDASIGVEVAYALALYKTYDSRHEI